MFLELHIFRSALKQVPRILNFNVSVYQSPNHQGVSSPTNMLVLAVLTGTCMLSCVHGMGNIRYGQFCGCETR